MTGKNMVLLVRRDDCQVAERAKPCWNKIYLEDIKKGVLDRAKPEPGWCTGG